MQRSCSERLEWLEPDGLGGFASGSTAGIRTRRYHALLLSAATPPTGRQVLVAGVDADVSAGGRVFALSSQRYQPGVVHPDGTSRLASFDDEPWPTWTYTLENGAAIEHSVVVPKDLPVVVLRWRAVAPAGLLDRLTVRPFLAARDYHSMQRENSGFRFEPVFEEPFICWQPYVGAQGILAASSGAYRHHPDWYRNFEYVEEHARGLDATEDLACPGSFEWEVAQGDAVVVFAAQTPQTIALFSSGSAEDIAAALEESERRRREAFTSRLDRSADAYIVRRGKGRTIIAGYPWFTDWGRDTFIAMRGLCLATGRYADARHILLAWASAVSEGMLPNRFADAGETPEFNAVDASLWFVVAAHELLEADPSVPAGDRTMIHEAIESILDGYQRGTRFGIRADDDGLLAAGVAGVQLTWMDARVGDRVVTPRIGKPVEIQALWINALWIAAQFNERWHRPFALAFAGFERFWNPASGTLYDVIDVDHVKGCVDAAFRPNQIFAAGGLPLALIDGDRARSVCDAVEARLWTPVGLRSLAPDDPGYQPHYRGGVAARDGAYHQGTVWPWLLGAFVDAWVRVRGGSAAARDEARKRFLAPLLDHLDVAGVGHLPEVADGVAPHVPGGCPFQAWSLGEALRLDRRILAYSGVTRDTGGRRRHRRSAVRTR